MLSVFKIDPVEILTEAKLEPWQFHDPDGLIGYSARDRLMSVCAAKTGCPHFGLLVGQQMSLDALGLVGLQVRSSPDVRTALLNLQRYFCLHTQGARINLIEYGNVALLDYSPVEPYVAGNDQTCDGAVAMMLNIMRTLCGAHFKPVEAQFSHQRPVNIRPFRQFFGTPLKFDAEHNALVFSKDWLIARRPGNDVELCRILKKEVDRLAAEIQDDFPEQVLRVLRSAIPIGHASAHHVAGLFSMHTRTLSRRLEQFDTSFHQLTDQVRFELARQLLGSTNRAVGEIGESLGYTRASAFTRAFRRWSGTTPVTWRAKRGVRS